MNAEELAMLEEEDEEGFSEEIRVILPDEHGVYEGIEEGDICIFDEDIVHVESEMIDFEEGLLSENLDMTFHLDLELGQTASVQTVEKFCLVVEWQEDNLLFYLGRESFRTIAGMITVTLSNRRTGERTIGQLASTLGYNSLIKPIKFERCLYFFSHTIFVEVVFERNDKIRPRTWFSVFFKDGMMQMQEDELEHVQPGPIDRVSRKCHTTLTASVFEYMDYVRVKEVCKTGFTSDAIISLHNLSDSLKIKIVGPCLDSLLCAPFTILEFLLIAEEFNLDQVTEVTLGKLRHRADISTLSNFAKYLGPKNIRQLLQVFHSWDEKFLQRLPKPEIVPEIETDILKTIQSCWSPKNSMQLPELQKLIDEKWTNSNLVFAYELSSSPTLVVLKQVEQFNERPVRPPSYAPCRLNTSSRYFSNTRVLRKSEFDVKVERDNTIKLTVEYADRIRLSTLWHINALITFIIKRADNTKLWEYSTNHTYSWNSRSLVIHALTEDVLKRHYQGPIKFEVQMTIVESEGFSKIEECLEPHPPGITYFQVGVGADQMEILVDNEVTSKHSTVLRKIIEEYPFEPEPLGLARRVPLPEISGRSLKMILERQEYQCDNLLLIDLCLPENQEVAVVARLLQHKAAMDAISMNIRKQNPTDRFRMAEYFGYDDVQSWCMQQIHNYADFRKIDCTLLDERSAAAVFIALRKLYP
ncbi:unnamed protein product [Caenorhabditis sp. 36 PRJEB53466]|nr:unnamed protein product [Caenorhabditis sp. 36 PRJEB53466]